MSYGNQRLTLRWVGFITLMIDALDCIEMTKSRFDSDRFPWPH